MVINLHCAFICKRDLIVKDTKMLSYTFCDISSGNNFTVFSLLPVKAFDTLKTLQVADLDFDLQITKSGLKLKALKEG